MSYIGNEPIVSATRTVTEVTATAGQTVFTANGGYTVGFLDVFINGSKLTSADFTATDGSTVTLTEAAQVSDIVRLEALGTFLASSALSNVNPSYTGTLTGGTGVVNIGSGQVYKDASGNVGIGTVSPTRRLVAQQTAVGEVARLVTTAGGAGATIGTVSLGFDVFGGQTNPFASIEVGEDETSPAGTYKSRMSFYTRNLDSDSAPAEQARITSTGLLQFNSGYGSVATAYGCRAWVNFNGTGTVAIRGSGNVSSITDRGTGEYRVNFTNAMPDGNYACVFGINTGNTTNPTNAGFNGSGLQTTSVDFGTFEGSNSAQDYARVTLAIFR